MICILAASVLAAGTGVWAAVEPAAEALPVTVEMTFGSGVDRTTRSVTGQSIEFAADGFSADEGQVFCLTRVMNAAAPATVTHVWYHEGKTMARVELNVGSADWRTWSTKRILPQWTGSWEVKVLDANGMVLATSGFTIK